MCELVQKSEEERRDDTAEEAQNGRFPVALFEYTHHEQAGDAHPQGKEKCAEAYPSVNEEVRYVSTYRTGPVLYFRFYLAQLIVQSLHVALVAGAGKEK